MTSIRTRFRRRTGRRFAAVAATLALALGAVACSSEDDDPEPEPSPSGSASATHVPPTTKLAKVTGPLAKKRRAGVSKSAGAAVDAWFEAAYLAGEYPRAAKTFRSAFPGFSPVARAAALKQLGIMSNADIAARIDGVTARQKRIDLDVLATKGAARGVTARVRLVFDTSGDLESRQGVSGRLNLVPAKNGWQIIAFDIAANQRALPSDSPSDSPSESPSESSSPEEEQS